MRERTILQTGGALESALRTAGTLGSWQDQVAQYAPGNSRLVLALSAAFAAPLIYPTGSESGGFHLRGASSTGKSTALVVAGSAWGGGGIQGWVQTWRATDNGLEGLAEMHCDCLLCLDELSQADSRHAGATAYMLSNGLGKVRASRSGDARAPAEWRLLFLSSGEIGLADKIAEDGRGRRAAAGQQVRIVDIAADAGAGMGIFEELHGFTTATVFADQLKAASRENYGHASRAFLRAIAGRFDDIAPSVRVHARNFIAEYCPSAPDGQVSRVATRFALVAAGGELATAYGVLPWETGEAMRGAARCFADWLAGRGGTGASEETDALRAVRQFIEMHGASRFEAMGILAPHDSSGAPLEQRILNRAGFRRRDCDGEIEYVILSETWRSEVCAGLDAGAVTKALVSRGLLEVGSDRKPQVQVRLPNHKGLSRCYVVKSNILADVDDTSPVAAT